MSRFPRFILELKQEAARQSVERGYSVAEVLACIYISLPSAGIDPYRTSTTGAAYSPRSVSTSWLYAMTPAELSDSRRALPRASGSSRQITARTGHTSPPSSLYVSTT